MRLPPLDGAFQVRNAVRQLTLTLGRTGRAGLVDGVTRFDGVLAGESPTAFVALTVNVYPVPLASPLTVALVWSPATVLVTPPGALVIVYPVIGEPFAAPGVQLTVADAFPRNAETPPG